MENRMELINSDIIISNINHNDNKQSITLTMRLHKPYCRKCYGVVEITEFSLSSERDWSNGYSLTGRTHNGESGLSN